MTINCPPVGDLEMDGISAALAWSVLSRQAARRMD
jgi:hypothetical protein